MRIMTRTDNKKKGGMYMVLSIIVLVAGIVLTKYGLASILAGIGGIAAGLGLKKGDGD